MNEWMNERMNEWICKCMIKKFWIVRYKLVAARGKKSELWDQKVASTFLIFDSVAQKKH